MSAHPPTERELARAAALARIAASRQHLRRQMIPPEEPATPGRPFSIPRRLRAIWRSLRRGLRGSPMAAVAMEALQQWWHGHPWRSTGELVAEELHATLTPVVRRHPVATMAASAALGLALVSIRPWRWSVVRRTLAPLPGRLTHWLFRQLGQAPGQALLSALLVMMARRQAEQADHAEQATPDPAANGQPCQPPPTAEQATGR